MFWILKKVMFDTHSHLFDKKILPQLDIILQQINSLNFLGVICICENEKDIEYFLKYYLKYNFLYCSIGIHPHNAKNFNEKNFLYMFETLKKTQRLVAIGETGLDFYYNFSDKETQLRCFYFQLKFAKSQNLPVIIHSRNSKLITYNILKEENITKGIIHCFSEDTEYAKKFVELGFLLGITGIITFEKSTSLKETLKSISISDIVVETDSPYLTPHPYRGRPNNPLYLKYILQEIEKIKGSSFDEIEKITDRNALRVFNLIQ
ncbi:MAG: TatD family hydrolase [Endomicrobiia bacterium]